MLHNPTAGIFKRLACVSEVFNKQLSRLDSSQVLVRCDMFQVSCLGVEPSADGDDARFVLTSRNPDGSVVRFQLLASSPEICRAWVNDVVQILESQRNFLNGKSQLSTEDDATSPTIHESCFLLAYFPFIDSVVSVLALLNQWEDFFLLYCPTEAHSCFKKKKKSQESDIKKK